MSLFNSKELIIFHNFYQSCNSYDRINIVTKIPESLKKFEASYIECEFPQY